MSKMGKDVHSDLLIIRDSKHGCLSAHLAWRPQRTRGIKGLSSGMFLCLYKKRNENGRLTFRRNAGGNDS